VRGPLFNSQWCQKKKESHHVDFRKVLFIISKKDNSSHFMDLELLALVLVHFLLLKLIIPGGWWSGSRGRVPA
jgi:hypothetical protein